MRKKRLKKKKARKVKRTRKILRRKKVNLRMTRKRKIEELTKQNMWSRLKVRFIKQTT